MKKNRFLGMMVLIFGIMLVSAFTACDNTPSEGHSSNENEFDYENLLQDEGNVTPVTVKYHWGGLGAVITIYYEGINGTTYDKSTTPPQAAGSYAVTFDVTGRDGSKDTYGLSAGTLIVKGQQIIDQTFTTIAALQTFLAAQPANTDATAYVITLNISDLGTGTGTNPSTGSDLGNALYANKTKYVNLNLSGSTITTIPNNAFLYYDADNNSIAVSSLTGITLPSSVTSIGYSAFQGGNLASITIPDSVTSIGDRVFNNCAKLTSVTLPTNPSFTSIRRETFNRCASLTSIIIPNSVTTIGESAFSSCTSLTSVTIPNSITSIGESAFSSCTSLTSVTIPNSVTSIGAGAFQNCSSLTGALVIPNSVTTIGTGAFSSCTSLASVTIPNSVTTIGQNAFNSCTNLTAITVDAANENYVSDEGVLYNKAKTTLIKYPAKKTGSSFTIPSSVTSIGENAFRSCTSLASVTMPGGASIGDYAFAYCTSLTSVTTNSYVYNSTSIGQYAFSNCTALTSFAIQSNVNRLGQRVFYFCNNLTSVTFLGAINEGDIGGGLHGESNNLRDAYLAVGGGAGTYTRSGTGSSATWTKEQPKDELYGTTWKREWTSNVLGTVIQVFTFNSPNFTTTLTLNDVTTTGTGTYSISGNTVTFNAEDNPAYLTGIISGNELTVTANDDDSVLGVFIKQ